VAKDFSFDVVSQVDIQHVSEAVQVVSKEVGTRYDFRGTETKVELDQKAGTIQLKSADEFKLKALLDMLNGRLAKRGLPLKNFTPEKAESALGGNAKQLVKIVQGIPKDKAKTIVASIKKSGLKVQPSIQGEQLRISGKSKDALQETMDYLKTQDFGLSLQFENYR
jgi:uncharacterized protein YajQ (UPF0234 family)